MQEETKDFWKVINQKNKSIILNIKQCDGSAATYKMPEVCHHASTLALRHVQGLDCGSQHIKSAVPDQQIHVKRYRGEQLVEGQGPVETFPPGGGERLSSPLHVRWRRPEVKDKQSLSNSRDWIWWTPAAEKRPHLSIDTLTFIEWFSSGTLTRSLETDNHSAGFTPNMSNACWLECQTKWHRARCSSLCVRTESVEPSSRLSAAYPTRRPSVDFGHI